MERGDDESVLGEIRTHSPPLLVHHSIPLSSVLQQLHLDPPPPAEIPLASRLVAASDNWRRIEASSQTILLITKGYRLPFRFSRPAPLHWQPRRQPNKFKTESWTPRHLQDDMERQVQEWIQLGAIEKTTSSKGFVHPLFGIPKKDSSEARPILDTRKLNFNLVRRHFQMDSLKTARQLLSPGEWMCKMDLSKAYWHVHLHKDTPRFLQFWWKGTRFQWKVMPFGISDAPRQFTLLVRQVLKFLRQHGIKIVAYIDDLLIMGNSKKSCKETTQFVRTIFESLGFLIKDSKSILEPTQELEFLGMTLNSKHFTISLHPKRRRALRRDIIRTLRTSHLNGKVLASILGKLNALHWATTATRESLVHLRALINSFPKKNRFSSKVPRQLTPEARQELHQQNGS